MLNFDGKYISFYFTCSRKFNKLNTYTVEKEGKSVIINVLRPSDNPSIVMVTAWAGKSKEKETLIFVQYVPYLKGQHYHITYNFDKCKEVVENISIHYDYEIVNDKFTWETEGYICKKFYPPKVAKNIINSLRKRHLISKTYWDRYMRQYDINCEACHLEGSSYNALSVPMYGKVLDAEDTLRFDARNLFYYKGKHYAKIPSKSWSYPTFWNKKELAEVAKTYEPKGEFLKWEDASTYEDFKGKFECRKDLPDFEVAWEKCGKYWTDNNGNYENFGGHSPIIGAWKKVASIKYLEWLDEFKFDKIWKENLTQEEIDSHGNIYGGAYRDKDRIDDWIIIAKDTETDIPKKRLEKVVTRGWHNTPYPHSIDCPVCRDMYVVCMSTDSWMPFWRNIRFGIDTIQFKVGLFFDNLKYDIRKKRRLRKEKE